MSDLETRVRQFFYAVTRGAFQGIRMGPGVLRTIASVSCVGLIAILGVVYFLSNNTLLAGAVAVFILAFLIYFIERSVRYAIAHPLPAVLAGTELYQLIRDQ